MTRIIRTGLMAAAVAATFLAVPSASAVPPEECLTGTALPPCYVCYELPLGDRKCVLVGGPIQT